MPPQLGAAVLLRRRLPRLHRRLGSTASAAAFPAVTTTRRLDIPTGWRPEGSAAAAAAALDHIPLAMNDVYALHEQLPYAYFFEETLSAEALAASLERVLAAFPALGGRLCLESLGIALAEGDTVPLAIGHTDTPLEEWLALGHGVDPLTGRPRLLALFDALPEQPWSSDSPLARVRVTHMAGRGTCIGVNISHAAADGASCIRFVYCWGRQHRGLPFLVPADNRAQVTANGMLTPVSKNDEFCI